MRKSLCKIATGLLKFIPMAIALVYLLNTVLSYFGISASILSIIGGLSMLPWLFLLIASFVFRFCVYHRMFLYYIFACDTIAYIDYVWKIPISNRSFFILNIAVAGIFLFIILYLRFRVCSRSKGN